MKKIAITGGIGSGKSTVCQIIKELGYPVHSCDEIYKEIADTQDFIQKIAEIFPIAVTEGKINKKTLSSIVFSNENELEKLNQISHPLIMKKLLEKMNTARSALVFAEVPLLFEGNYQNLFDFCLIIRRKKADRIQAVQKRDNISKKEILERIKNQVNHCKIKSSPTVFKITNNGSREELQEKIENYIKTLYE